MGNSPNGPFSEKKPIKGKKRGALGPGPSRPGLGFWGLDDLAPPQDATAALALPLAAALVP
jgi:hypothetical protein